MTMNFFPTSEATFAQIADEQGFFAKHGLKVNFKEGPPVTTEQIALLLNGQIDAGQGAVTAVIAAASEGIPVQVVAAGTEDCESKGLTSFEAITEKNSPIKSFKDLEGKTVGINSLKGNWEVAILQAVKNDGGDPSKVKLVEISLPDQIAALQQGRVDAVSTFQPFAAQLRAEGYPGIGDPQASALEDPHGSSTVLLMAKKFTEENPEAAEGFVAAVTESAKYANEHPKTVSKLTSESTGAPLELVEKAPTPCFTTVMPESTIEKWSELMEEYGALESSPEASEVLWSGAPK